MPYLVSWSRLARIVALGVALAALAVWPAGAQEPPAAPEAAQAQEAGPSQYEPAQADAAAQPSAKAEVTDEPRAQTAQTDGDRDCADFDSRQEAQEYFEEQGGGPDNNVDRLDEDGDGEACEELGDDDVPEGGPNAGGGWLSSGTDGGGPAGPLAVLALLLVAAAGLARTRLN